MNFVIFLCLFRLVADKCVCTALVASDHPTTDIRTQTNGGSSQASWPIGRRGHTAVVYGNSMYIYGGYIDMKGASAELWQYNFGLFEHFLVNIVAGLNLFG